MKINGVIQKKFALLDKQLMELQKHLAEVKFTDFKDSWVFRSMTERALQVMVEIVIDIAERIISLKDAGPVASSAEAFEKLEQLGIIKSADDYRDMVKFRNLIVHQYEEIDPAIVFDIAKNKIGLFRKFRGEIDKL